MDVRESRIRWLAFALGLGLTAGAAAHAQSVQNANVRRISLDDALRAAESASENVAIAEAGVGRAHGQQYQARSQLLPRIAGSASYTRTLRSARSAATS